MTPRGLLPNILNIVILEGSMTLHNGGSFLPEYRVKNHPVPTHFWSISITLVKTNNFK
jgi:hypothetical protein